MLFTWILWTEENRIKNKCSNKIALSSNNNLLLTAFASWFAVTRCPCAKNTFLTKDDASNQEMDKRPNEQRKKERTDGILNFVSILAIYFYLVGFFSLSFSLFTLYKCARFLYLLLLSASIYIHVFVCALQYFFSTSPHAPLSFHAVLSILAAIFHFVLWSTLHIKMKWVGKMIG